MRFKENPRLYAFTTENISGYLKNLDLKNKSLLVVTGSGDHIINSLLLGAKKILAFDINTRAKFFAELKIQAIIHLNFIEFKEFFLISEKDGNTNKKALNFLVYNQLRKKLSIDAKDFFDKQYKEYQNNGAILRQSPLFNNQYDKNELKIRSNLYLHSEENYEKARKFIQEVDIKFITCSLQELSHNLNEKLDIILLSNIADYAKEMFNFQDYLQEFKEKVIQALLPYINPGGLICIAYIYDAHETEPFRSDIDNSEKRRKVFKDGKFKYNEMDFESVVAGKIDKIILISKEENGKQFKTFE